MNIKNDHQSKDQQLIILNIIYNIYSHFMAMVMLHAIFNWPEIIKDDEKRNTLNSILFSKMQKIHNSVYEAFQYKSKDSQISLHIPVFANIILAWFKLNRSYLNSAIEIGKVYNLSHHIEKLLNIVWKVSYPLLPFARPLFEKNEHIENHKTKMSNLVWRPINWKEALKYYEKGFLNSELNNIVNKGKELY